MRTTSRTAIALVAAVLSACGASTSSRKPGSDAGGPDTGLANGDSSTKGTGGTGGKGGSGGGGAGGTGAGGAGGIGGTSAGGTGGNVPDASVVPDASIVPDASVDAGNAADAAVLVCRAPVLVDGGVFPDGAVADPGQWHDFAAGTCVACPAPAITCSNFDEPSSSFDPTTKKLTMVLAAGVAQVVSGSVTVYWDALLADGGFKTGTATATVTAIGNRLVADLTGQVPDRVIAVHQIQPDLRDACGVQSPFQFGALASPGDAALPGVNLHCEQ